MRLKRASTSFHAKTRRCDSDTGPYILDVLWYSRLHLERESGHTSFSRDPYMPRAYRAYMREPVRLWIRLAEQLLPHRIYQEIMSNELCAYQSVTISEYVHMYICTYHTKSVAVSVDSGRRAA
jgi:hypothetical protein